MDETQKNLNSVHINDETAEIICRHTTAASMTFDATIGHIEDIIIGKYDIFYNKIIYNPPILLMLLIMVNNKIIRKRFPWLIGKIYGQILSDIWRDWGEQIDIHGHFWRICKH